MRIVRPHSLDPFSMKLLLVLLLTALPFHAFGQSTTPEELAKQYVLAVQARDAAAIRHLMHPKVLETLHSSGEEKFLDWWIERAMANASQLVHPMWIRPKNISTEYLSSLSGHWTWSVPPEVQIEMQPYKVVGEAKEGTGFMTVEMAARFNGQLFFVLLAPKKKP